MAVRNVRLFAMLAVLASGGAAFAQSLRAEEIAQKQAEKAGRLRPYEKSRAEKAINAAEEVLVGTRTVYPWVGSIYPGGWLGLGAGYRHGFADTALVNAMGAWSLKNYKLLRADFSLPELVGRRLVFATNATWLDAPSVAFYGVGNETGRDDRTTYEYQPTTVGFTGAARLVRWLSAGGGADYLDISSSLGEDVTYTVGRAFAGIDWRESAGYSRSGGLYRVEWSNYADRETDRFGFRQTEAEIIQLLPLLRANWVLAFRGLLTTTDVDEGDAVPLFLLPALGGGSTLRGYPSWRFRDRHRLLLSGEYRWIPAQMIDMALFYDAGKVASRRSDLDLDGLKTDYGVGIRFHGLSFTALRFDVARGREGWVFNFTGGAAF
jgi:hypothetical protein